MKPINHEADPYFYPKQKPYKQGGYNKGGYKKNQNGTEEEKGEDFKINRDNKETFRREDFQKSTKQPEPTAEDSDSDKDFAVVTKKERKVVQGAKHQNKNQSRNNKNVQASNTH